MSKPPLTPTCAAARVRSTFAKFGFRIPVHEDDLSITNNVVLLGLRGNRIADSLFDFAFPPSPSGTYYHYTSYSAFKSIVSSGKLNLYNLHRRFRSGEFRTFCRDYGLDGYVHDGPHQTDAGLYPELMDNLFYISFVDSPIASAERLWQTFGNKHQGVRLTFEVNIKPHYPNFRRVSYQNSTRVPILKALQDAFLPYDRRFVTLGISRMGGFYQRLEFAYQAEHRLLVKRIPGEPFQFRVNPAKRKPYKFIECDLSKPSCTAFAVKLLEVTPGKCCPLTKVETYLNEKSKLCPVHIVPL